MQIHRSNRLERLVDVLAEVLRHPAGGALAEETILIQSQGMERWLNAELARRLGVFANARFPFPRAFVEEVFQAVLGAPDEAKNYSVESLAFAIAGALPELQERREFSQIRGYLAGDDDGKKRFSFAERVAHLFDQYVVYRPELVLSWVRGSGRDWQAELFRHLVVQLGNEHFAARAERFVKEWSPLLVPEGSLPRRVSVVGVSYLPPVYLSILNSVSERVDVQVFLLTPCQEYFAHDATGSPGPDAPSMNPLLASLGRMGREFQYVLERDTHYRETERSLFEPARGSALLGAVQNDILEMRVRHAQSANVLDLSPDDDSIALLGCHSPVREVEVLKNQLLYLLERDASLEPRDILVMTPNVDAYAPLIDAVFGVDAGRQDYIPYSISDRSEPAENPCAAAFLSILESLSGRMKASELLDLLQFEPVRARFGIDGSELHQVQRWVHDAGIRWGIDGAHRSEFQQPADDANTWHFGLERLLMGYALPASSRSMFEGRLAADDIEGERAELLGKLVEFSSSLFALKTRARERRSVAAWGEALDEVIGGMLFAKDADSWQLNVLRDAHRAVREQAERARFSEPISLALLGARLRQELEARRRTHRFLGGTLTFCAMLPMRSLPFRVVAVLGMNDGEFPRIEHPLSFDLMAQHKRPGDRSPKDEDRYLFLEALLSAREHFLVTYVGRSIQDNASLLPSSPVAELVEYARAGFTLGEKPPELVVEHPLAPFSPRYFTGGEARLSSYAAEEAAGARALLERRPVEASFVGAALGSPQTLDELPLARLVRFLQNPARGLLQQRLGLYLADDPLLVEDREPLELSPMQRYDVGSLLLEQALEGRSEEAAHSVVRATGRLPHGTPGDLSERDLWQTACQIAERARPFLVGTAEPVRRVEARIGNITVTGLLRDLYRTARVERRFARLKPKDELRLWLEHLLLCVTCPEPTRASVLLGRALEKSNGADVAICAFAPLSPQLARGYFEPLLELFWLGQQVPVPLFPHASKTYVEALKKGKDEQRALKSAESVFQGRRSGFSEADDESVSLVFTGPSPILAEASEYESPTVPIVAPSFAQVSLQVFGPLLEHRDREAEA